MKNLLLLLIVLFPMASLAQTSPYNGYCTLGATQASLSGLLSTNYLQGIVPVCTVTVYITGTQTPATIYKDSSGTTLTNPFTATTSGQWLFYASPSSTYDVILSGGNYPNYFPVPVALVGVPSGAAGGGSGGGVTSLDGITGAVALHAGSGITITDNTPTAGQISIASTGGSTAIAQNQVATGTGTGITGVNSLATKIDQTNGYAKSLGAVSAAWGLVTVSTSIGTGVGVIPPQTLAYTTQLAKWLGVTNGYPLPTSAKQSGAAACDLAYLYPHNYLPVDANSPIITVEAVTNDGNQYGTSTANQQGFKQCFDTLGTWGSQPPASRLFTAPVPLTSSHVNYHTGVSGSVTTGIVTVQIPSLVPNYVSNGYQYVLSGATTLTALNGVTVSVYGKSSSSITTNGTDQVVFNYTCSGCAAQLPTYAVTSASAASSGQTTYAGSFTGCGTNACVNNTMNVAGFTNTGNNGSFVVVASSTASITVNNPNGVAETTSATAADQDVTEALTLTPANWTETGSGWGSDTTTYPLFSVATDTTANDTISVPLLIGSNGVVILHYYGYPSGTATFNATINGTVATDTITNSQTLVAGQGANPPLVSGFQTVPIIMTAIFKGQTSGPGTVSIKNLSGGNIGIVDVGSPQGVEGGGNAPNTYMLGLQKQDGDLKSATTAQYDTWALSNAAELGTLNLRVYPCSIRDYTNSDDTTPQGTYWQTDLAPLHPGPVGAQQFARAFQDCIQQPTLPVSSQYTLVQSASAGQGLQVSAPGAALSQGSPVTVVAGNGPGFIGFYNSGLSPSPIRATGNSVGNKSEQPGCGDMYVTPGNNGQIFPVGTTCPQMTWKNLPNNPVTQVGGSLTLTCTSILQMYLLRGFPAPTIVLDNTCNSPGTVFAIKNISGASTTISGAAYGDATGTITLANNDTIVLEVQTYAGVGGYFIVDHYQSAGYGGITALTGDVTASGSGSVVATLATVNSNVGSFTNANITVNAKGLITAASNGTGTSGVSSINANTGAFTFAGSGVSCSGTTCTFSGTGSGVTSFAAPSTSWPTWLVPSVTNPSTTPSLAVTASAIPYSAFANLAANQVLGALTGTTPSGLTVPSCSGANQALNWTSGTGYGCVTISGSSGISGLSYGYIPLAGSATTITTNSHIDDGVTTSATLTATEPVVAPSYSTNGSSNGNINLTSTGSAPSSAAANTVQITVPNSVTAYTNTIPGSPPSANGQTVSVTTAGLWSWVSPYISSLTVTGTNCANASVLSGVLNIPACVAGGTSYAAHTFYGNNTGSSTSPSASAIGVSDFTPNSYAVTTGSVNALVVSFSPSVTSLVAGLEINVLPNLANTSTTPTINANGLGAKVITKNGTTPLSAGDLTTTAIASLIYDGTEFQLQNPQTGGGGATLGANTFTGTQQAPIFFNSGTSQTSGNITLSAGWGSTASVSAVTGYGQRFRFTITVGGTGIVASPTFTATLPTSFPSAPLCVAMDTGGTGAIADLTSGTESTTSTGTMTWLGTPSSGLTYIITVDCR